MGAAGGSDPALLLSVFPEPRMGPGAALTAVNTYQMNERMAEPLVRGMNGRADESASDKHEVTRTKRWADGTLAEAAQYRPGKTRILLGLPGG